MAVEMTTGMDRQEIFERQSAVFRAAERIELRNSARSCCSLARRTCLYAMLGRVRQRRAGAKLETALVACYCCGARSVRIRSPDPVDATSGK